MPNNLSYNALRLETAGRNREKDVLNSLVSCGIASLCYAFKSRVKSETKLVEKVNRKVREKADYELSHVTDVIGLRLITLFRNEIHQVLNEILKLIRHEKDLKPNPFEKCLFEEVIIYTNAPSYDPFLADLKAVLAENEIEPKITQSKEGYSSVHIVTRLVDGTKLKLNDGEVDHKLPIEIQIRSVFEDAWGEIDHKFGYVVRAGKNNENVVQNAALIQPHLQVLKQFTDACAQYADIIYKSATTPVVVQDSVGKIVSVPSDDKVISRFKALGVPEKFCNMYLEGRLLREKALERVAEDKARGQSECLKVATYFLGLNQEAENELVEGAGRSLYSYYAKMNEALCLLSTDSPAHVTLSESIYLKLREQYPTYPLVKFRLAQANGRLGRVDDSIYLYLETRTEIAEMATSAAQHGEWPDNLPLGDYEHISGHLPKLLGYQYWKKSEHEADRGTKLRLLLEAFNATREGLKVKSDDVKICNNLAYYATEYLSILDGESTPESEDLGMLLLQCLVVMERSVGEVDPDISMLDTMMRAYRFLGNVPLAKKTAEQIIVQVKASAEGDPEETLIILKCALDIQALPESQQPGNTFSVDKAA